MSDRKLQNQEEACGQVSNQEIGISDSNAEKTDVSENRGAYAAEQSGIAGGQAVSAADILKQMEIMQKQTKYLEDTIEKLSLMQDGDSGEACAPGNVMGEAKAKALGDVVRCRENTNQEMLRLYGKMYEDTPARADARQKAYGLVECVINNHSMDENVKKEIISEILRHIQG